MKNFGKRTENLDFANIGDIPTKLSQLTNDAGYLTVGTLPTNLVTTDKAQTITGLKTFDAPVNISGTEQSTAIFKTSNGGQLIVGKEGANSGTMLRFDQVAGTVRLRFRASATAGAMVWEQPEQGAQLYIDLGKSGADYRRITFPSAAGTLALTSQITADTGATSVEVVGSGNAVTAANYTASTRKLTLTKGATFLTSHQSIKSLNTNNTAAQLINPDETIVGSGTINLHQVAKTGSYLDLLDTPTIPSAPNNGILTIQKNGTTIATFGANQSDNKTANITVPVKVSELTNDSGFLTAQDITDKVSYTSKSGVSVAGTAKTVSKVSPETLFVPSGLIMGGTAASAGLVTRGICGVSTPNADGSCNKENLYINYDGDNNYERKLVLGAGSVGAAITASTTSGGTNYGHMYSAIRGDQMVRYVNAKIPTDYLIGGSQTTTSTADGGSNIFTFTKANGTTATFTVRNGSKGSAGKDGENGLDALVYNNVIFVNSIPDEESKGNLTLKGGDFNRFPKNPETFWAIMSDNSGAEEAVQFIIDDYDPITDIASCGWLNRRNIKGEQGERGDDGVGISTATTGTPTVGTDGYTTTPITFKKTDNSTILVNVKAKNGKDGTDATITSINGLKGGTLTSPLVITGGDQATAAKIALDQGNKGQITDSSTSTIFGFMSSGTLTVGSTSYVTNIRGKNTRPTYNGNNLALLSDVPTVNNGKLTIKQGGVEKGSFSANQSGNVEIDLEGGGGASYITYTAIYMSYSGAVDVVDGNPIEDFFCKLWIPPLCTSDVFTTGSDFLSWLGANTFANETSALACNGYSPQLGAACACWNDGTNILYVEFSNGQVVMLSDEAITISSNSFSAYL